MARTPLTLPVSGAKFRTLRELRGLHQSDVETLTEVAGHRVERSRLSLIETSKATPTPKQLKALLDVYDVEVEAVLDEAS